MNTAIFSHSKLQQAKNFNKDHHGKENCLNYLRYQVPAHADAILGGRFVDQEGMVTIPEMGTPNFKMRWEEVCARAVLWYYDTCSFHDSKNLGRRKETVVCYVVLCVAVHSKASQGRPIMSNHVYYIQDYSRSFKHAQCSM